MVKITGRKEHIRRLRKLVAETEPLILQALYVGGQIIEIDAEHSITDGSISGKGHVPSDPGDPPNADTRLLDTSIETTVASASPPQVNVTSEAPYSAALELGTSKMEERPYMRPATNRNRAKVRSLIVKAVKEANARSKNR